MHLGVIIEECDFESKTDGPRNAENWAGNLLDSLTVWLTALKRISVRHVLKLRKINLW